MKNLDGIKVAILTEEGFEQAELTSPKQALEKAGAKTVIISPRLHTVRGWNHDKWGIELPVDVDIDAANPNDYDALVLPGGVMNPDKLRQNFKAVEFVKEMLRSGKTVAAICHGPQMLIETGMIDGKTLTSFPSIRTDLHNAGANWVNEEVVCVGNLITSRKPADLDAFNKALIEALSLQEH